MERTPVVGACERSWATQQAPRSTAGVDCRPWHTRVRGATVPSVPGRRVVRSGRRAGDRDSECQGAHRPATHRRRRSCDHCARIASVLRAVLARRAFRGVHSPCRRAHGSLAFTRNFMPASSNSRHASRFVSLCLLSFAASCGTSVTSSIGPAGGTVEISGGSASGARVIVPANTVVMPTQITVRLGGTAVGLPEGFEATGSVIIFGPEGYRFTRPVEINVPSGMPASVLFTRAAGSATAWSPVLGAIYRQASGDVQAFVDHFSEFVPARATDGGTGCMRPLAACGAACVDLTSDPANCGQCGARCSPPNGLCESSHCTMGGVMDSGVPCNAPRTMCGTACVDMQTDLLNCGACGTVCTAGQTCTAGRCMGSTMCAAPSMLCAGFCTDVTSDVRNCGACGTRCATGEVCFTSRCVGTDAGVCLPPNRMCGATCIDVTTDRANCGACGLACAGGQTCSGAVCR